MSGTDPSTDSRPTAYWALRVAETALLVAMLAGIALFAYSIVDIVRIETKPGATNQAGAPRELPPTAYPGLALFLGGMIALQGVRVVLHRYRRSDGTARGAEADAIAATAAALAEDDDGPADAALYSDGEPALAAADDPREA